MAELARRQLAFGQVCMVVATAALVAMAAPLVKRVADRNKPPAGGPALRPQVDLH